MAARTKNIAMAVVLTAISVILAPFYFPVGTTKCYPFQHTINAIAGVILGPQYAALMATITGIIRNFLGTGSPFAFPGGIPGALMVDFAYRYLLKTDYAALTEPIGTGLIGATLSALIVGPMIGKTSARYKEK